MRFMNEYDIERARRVYADHDVLTAAVETVDNLRRWANANSDGWAYWPKPCRAAASLMALISGDGTNAADTAQRAVATPAAYRKACAPIKAFRTRCEARGMDTTSFVIVAL